MRIFTDLDMVEQLGSGVPGILAHYGKECFRFMPNFLRMTLMSQIDVAAGETIDDNIGGVNEEEIGGQVGGQAGGQVDNLTERQKEVFNIILSNQKISRKQISEKLGINESAVQKHIDALKKKNIIERDSATTGQWIIKV